MGIKQLAAGLAILVVLGTDQVPVLARKHQQQQSNVPDSTILNSTVAGPFQSIDADVLDPVTGQLLWQLSHKPELMNLDYLHYYLGPPDKQNTQIGVRTHAYYWYDKLRRVRAELYQENDKPGEVVESIMLFHLPAGDLNFDLLKETLGPPVRNYFDRSGDPTQMYYYVPNTTLAMASPPNTFSVRKATVTYIGPPLLQPSSEDIQLAHDSFVAKTQNANLSTQQNNVKIDWTETLVLARRRVQEHPNDSSAHAALAEALKKTGNVHEAINEYKTSLLLNKYNLPVRLQCIQGLKDLYVLPQDYGSDTQGAAGVQPLPFTQNGQGMPVAGSGAQKSN